MSKAPKCVAGSSLSCRGIRHTSREISKPARQLQLSSNEDLGQFDAEKPRRQPRILPQKKTLPISAMARPNGVDRPGKGIGWMKGRDNGSSKNV
jgi:hypothetical protein